MIVRNTSNIFLILIVLILVISCSNSTESIIKEDYHLYKTINTKTVLILYPGGGDTAQETKEEFDVIDIANTNNVSVLMMNFNRHLWIDAATSKLLANELEQIFEENALNPDNIYIGGISIGGNVALSVSNYLLQEKSSISPKGVFIVDSPIDLFALYESSVKDISNPDFDEERLVEPKWIIDYFEEQFSKDSLLSRIQKVSPFTFNNNYTSVPYLKNIRVRFYTEPDSLWWKENRQTDFESTNAFAIQQITKELKSKNWNKLELIETKNNGYRSTGEKHPHSWSIVDVNELIIWMKDW